MEGELFQTITGRENPLQNLKNYQEDRAVFLVLIYQAISWAVSLFDKGLLLLPLLFYYYYV